MRRSASSCTAPILARRRMLLPVPPVARLLVITGLVLVALGVLLWLAPGLGGLGRLPGDLRIERPNLRVYVPLTTSLARVGRPVRAALAHLAPALGRCEPMRLAILTLGSRGDVQPYVALARGLAAAGYEPVVLAAPAFRDVRRVARGRVAQLRLRRSARAAAVARSARAGRPARQPVPAARASSRSCSSRCSRRATPTRVQSTADADALARRAHRADLRPVAARAAQAPVRRRLPAAGSSDRRVRELDVPRAAATGCRSAARCAARATGWSGGSCSA